MRNTTDISYLFNRMDEDKCKDEYFIHRLKKIIIPKEHYDKFTVSLQFLESWKKNLVISIDNVQAKLLGMDDNIIFQIEYYRDITDEFTYYWLDSTYSGYSLGYQGNTDAEDVNGTMNTLQDIHDRIYDITYICNKYKCTTVEDLIERVRKLEELLDKHDISYSDI